MLVSSKLVAILAASGLALGAISFNKIYSFASSKTSKLKKPKAIETLDDMTRVKIFDKSFFTTNKLTSLLNYSHQSGKTKFLIDERKIEETLKPFIREELKKVFLRNNWNFNELEGKIYYEIRGKSIEIMVTWKDNSFSSQPTHFDQFELFFE
ncbi:hypothetical protein MHSWG343_01040 [Candidatus Mycoplasma haematohominis]|uniref:Uncharacterized protein n=1 Tax=Candidatus Mycoplasma haematohominis TaxID=1494318 RepID=A0A478FRY8_9MOLU|nr:hypothetical protein MHSWG343_01040 [Candidatus Mycoplasma haemohominis]